MKHRYLVPFLVLDVYATLMIMGGVLAFTMAPPEANPTTAIVIPGTFAALIFACAAMVFAGGLPAINKPGLARLGLNLGTVLALLIALAIAMPANARTKAWQKHPQALQEWNAALAAGTVQDQPEAKEAFFDERKAADHDITYLVYTLWGLTGLSVLAFGALLVTRPKRDAWTPDPSPASAAA